MFIEQFQILTKNMNHAVKHFNICTQTIFQTLCYYWSFKILSLYTCTKSLIVVIVYNFDLNIAPVYICKDRRKKPQVAGYYNDIII